MIVLLLIKHIPNSPEVHQFSSDFSNFVVLSWSQCFGVTLQFRTPFLRQFFSAYNKHVYFAFIVSLVRFGRWFLNMLNMFNIVYLACIDLLIHYFNSFLLEDVMVQHLFLGLFLLYISIHLIWCNKTSILLAHFIRGMIIPNYIHFVYRKWKHVWFAYHNCLSFLFIFK